MAHKMQAIAIRTKSPISLVVILLPILGTDYRLPNQRVTPWADIIKIPAYPSACRMAKGGL